MDNPLKIKIQDDMKNAMRAKDAQRLGIIRMILAALKQKEVDERIELDEPTILGILDKMLKQRRESFEQFKAAQRQDLAEKESFEISVILEYMPTVLNNEELNTIIIQAIKETEAKSSSDMGKVMAQVKTKAQGRADMREVSELIKQKLQEL